MTLSTQRTLFNTDLHLAMLFGRPYTTLPHSTLNEKFGAYNNVASYLVQKKTEYPVLQYLTIGVGGTPGINNSKGFIHSEHSPLDASLFSPIPFAMYEEKEGVNNDMDLDRQKNYRFRIRKHHSDGKTYICYYLRCIENLENVYDNKFQKIKNIGNETFISTLDTNNNMLEPQPRTRKLDYKTIGETEFITKLCKIKVTFDYEEIQDLYNVYKILGIKTNLLTEMGLCSGIEVTNKDTGVSLDYPIDVQIMFFLDLNLDLTSSFNNGKAFTKYIEIGGAEPLIEGLTSEAD